MLRKIALFTLFSLLLAAILLPTPARADGIIIPLPPPCPGPEPCPVVSPMTQLIIRYHKVNVTIDDQVAVTRVDQVFYNPNDWQVEGTYIFPLPVDAAVSGFSLWVDGKQVEAKILEAGQARQTYQEIVSSLRDPALLEYAGRGAVQASIFPIPPKGERRVELEYTQALTAENGLVRYIYPLSTEKFSLQPLEQVSVNLDVHSSVPIRAVYSPSHPVAIERLDDTHVRASYEASHVLPEADFALYYSLGETQAFHLLSVRDPGDAEDPNGFFLLLLAPSPQAESRPLPKDIILVLDRSGSMEGEKFNQALEAASYILRQLNPEDHFNLVSFSSDIQVYARTMRVQEEASEAIAWLASLSAAGSTDIHRALLEAAAITDRERPTYLIFLTDGLPTEGVTESQPILDDFARSAPDNLRLFPFGVGYDVDTFLLDSLAQEHHGLSTYVLPDERLDESLSAFYAKISTPVLTNLALDFGGLSVYDLYPSPLPDLFSGSQIVLTGRYREGGQTDVSLSGQVEENQQVFNFPDQVFASNSPADDPLMSSLPRLWATRKIGYLLNQVRLQGAEKELVDQIVHLSIRYGIVTPYTSYLVTEDVPLGEAAQELRSSIEYKSLRAPAEVSGEGAVRKAADQGAMAEAESAALAPVESIGRVRSTGARTFVLKDGVWIDTGFDPERMQTVKVAFLSDDYFALAEARPELAAAFALGQAVIALSDGTAYEVVSQETETTPLEIPPTRTPQPQLPGVAAQPPAPAQLAEPPSSGLLPCLGALLPLVFLAAFGLWKRR